MENELVKKKPPRKMSDEIDQETGEAYEDIPGAEYPPEMVAVETAATLPYGAGAGSIIRGATEKVGNAAARSVTSKALEKMKEMKPSPEQLRNKANIDPKFNQLLGEAPAQAEAQLGQQMTQNRRDLGNLQAAKQYGSETSRLPSSKLDYTELNAIKRKPESPGLDYTDIRKGIVKKIKRPE